MRTIQKTVYKFDELNDEAKEKVINSFRDDPIDFEFEANALIEYWKERLQEIGFEDAEIQYSYSGFYHQGEGASFTADVNPEKVINAMIMCNRLSIDTANLYNKMLYMTDLNIVELIYMVYRTSHHYSQEMTVSVDSDSEFYLNDCSKAEDYFYDAFEQLRDDIQDYMRELCQEIFFNLRMGYEHINSDEYITENIKNNEYEFYADGSLY
jgi:hypothetical protein